MSDGSFVVGALIFALLMCFVGVVAGATVAEWQMQAEAVKLGHAEWSHDANGWSKFHWKEATK